MKDPGKQYKAFENYSISELIISFSIEFIATIIVIFLKASPVSLAPLIGGVIFSTNPILILFIAIANGFAIYTVYSAYSRFRAGYTNIITAIIYLVATEYRKRGPFILLKIILFFVAELIGSIIGVLFIWAIIGDRGTDFGKPVIGPNVSVGQAFGYEIFGTFIYLIVSIVANLKFETEPDRSLVSGLTLFIVVLVGIPISGASLNYFRHFASALVSNSWQKTDWIYYIGPTIGGISAAIFITILMYVDYRYPYSYPSILRNKNKKEQKV
jgi:glycerol uptake facilitator-like aquaporin